MATSLLFIALIISLVNGQEPTDAPTLEPTKPPTPNFNNLNYDACVIGDNIGGGSMIVSFSRNIEYDIVEITMKGADNRWFGFGFGSSSMQNTYAIISYNSSRTEEWKLALHDEGNQLTESSFVDLEVSESDGIRTVIVKRPYNFGSNYYDFTPFITATETSIDIIAAYGPADEKFPIKHEEKYIDSVMTQCLPIGGSTPSPVTIPAGKPTIGKASVTNYLFGILLGLAIIVFT